MSVVGATPCRDMRKPLSFCRPEEHLAEAHNPPEADELDLDNENGEEYEYDAG